MTVLWRDGTIYGSGILTGSPPQWGDLSDATYVTTYRLQGGNTGSPIFDWAAYPDAASITSAALGIRARIDPAYNGGGFLFAYITDFSGGGRVNEYYLNGADGTVGTSVVEMTLPITTDLSKLAMVQSALGFDETLQVNLSVGTDVGTDPPETRIDIYEVWLELGFDPLPTGRTFVPPLRIFPRPDGRGASSAPRIWPRPPTGDYGRIGPGSLI